jgi:outer membrane protein TolC
MKVQGFLVLFVFFAAIHSPASVRAGDNGDSSASLSAFVDQALRANPRLQAAKSRAQGAQARIPQAGAWDDPQAGVEFFATPITSANPFKDGTETDYFVQQMIPLFGKKGLMSDAASAGARMTEQTALAAERIPG